MNRSSEKSAQHHLAMGSPSRETTVAQNLRDAAPILSELQNLGYHVKAFSDLGLDGKPYKDAVPVLVKWLPTVTNPDVKEAIVRALSVPWAPPAVARVLIAEFEKTEDHSLKWAIGNAMSIMVAQDVAQEVIRIATDPRNGKTREMFTVALGRLRCPEAAHAVLGLLDDEVVQGHAAIAAGKLGMGEALPKLIGLANHPKAWIRAEAQKAIRTIEKKLAGGNRARKPN